MAVYKFNKDLKGRIEPIPGDVVDLGVARLKVVEGGIAGDPGEGCHNCFLDNPPCHADIDQELLDSLCRRTRCDGVIREDKTDIHYEEEEKE